MLTRQALSFVADHTRNHIEKTVYADEESIDEGRLSYYSTYRMREDQLHDLIRKTDESPRRTHLSFPWKTDQDRTEYSGMAISPK